ncbi:MAG: SLBB domain-containing protein, partial [Cyanobacteria bacterium P01_F01_bin.4]
EIGSPTTLSGALSLAGGITPNANLRNIIIRRAVAGEDGAVAGSGVPETELSVDLWRAIQTGDLEADLRIYDGDEIIVPTAQISSVDQQLLLTSTVAPTTVTVQVAGAVNDPGQIEIDPQAGVSAAVAAAGGLTDEARSDTIALFRMSADGQLAQQTFTFGEASPPILEGDLIVVDRSTRSNVGGLARFFNLLLNPVNSILNVFD